MSPAYLCKSVEGVLHPLYRKSLRLSAGLEGAGSSLVCLQHLLVHPQLLHLSGGSCRPFVDSSVRQHDGFDLAQQAGMLGTAAPSVSGKRHNQAVVIV